jgi:S1-C subfamily serine protease
MKDRQAIERLVTEAGPGVVGLRERARGSGVVVGAQRVLTLASNLRGKEPAVVFGDGRRERGRLLGADPDLSIALLEVATGDSPPVAFADGDASAPPAIGEPVFALANPSGRGLRVTAGAVASAPRSLRGPRGRPLEGLIEHTAPVPRGAGGGPLLDEKGRLLGLNAVRLEEGLILALPGARIRARLDTLADEGARAPRRLGVAIVPPRAARRLRRAVGLPEREGILVRAVQQRGDLIVSLQDSEIASLDALFGALDAAPLEQPIPVRVVRGEEERELDVTLEPA